VGKRPIQNLIYVYPGVTASPIKPMRRSERAKWGQDLRALADRIHPEGRQQPRAAAGGDPPYTLEELVSQAADALNKFKVFLNRLAAANRALAAAKAKLATQVAEQTTQIQGLMLTLEQQQATINGYKLQAEQAQQTANNVQILLDAAEEKIAALEPDAAVANELIALVAKIPAEAFGDEPAADEPAAEPAPADPSLPDLASLPAVPTTPFAG
jgi:DNA repair exonuclease SbcCD ATPase subunit